MAGICDNDKELEIIKVEAKNAFSKALDSISHSSATKQLVVGSVSGWTTGYITMKVGKSAAFALGGGIILFQIAQNKGYITIDWNKIKKKAEQATEKVETTYEEQAPRVLSRLEKFALANTCFAAGFIGGFLIGLAS